jgi:hypothetical protein
MIRSYPSLLFWLGMTIAASLLLYHTSDRVNALDSQLREINAQIDSEQENMRVLNAEWVYLSNPERIEAEVDRYSNQLNLRPTAPGRVVAMQNIGDLLPMEGTATLLAKAKAASPVQTAQAVSKGERVVAELNAGRINDHMKMLHTEARESASSITLALADAKTDTSGEAEAEALAKTDKIGALISSLGLIQ